uniref:Integrase, catalytic region, zinc finger, CCHC-type, peptidase aspartic, catalytic n=1 Tax=Tanacetum cinerariifolium TaxID=118510 RepID=A0A6L2JBK8_TANCI|nr:hypothetical protein [Tanacetum cinerariifolium]
MILESVENGLLIWPTIEENGVTRTKNYAELSTVEKIQDDCDMKATNIILQGIPADTYLLVNHHRVAKDLWERVKLLMQGDDLIACLNKLMAFLTVVASSRFPSTYNQLRTSSNLRNQASIQDGRVIVQQVQGRQGEGHMARQCTHPKQPRNVTWYKNKEMLAEAQEAGQILDEEKLTFLTDQGVLNGQAVQTIIPTNAGFQPEDLDTYDSNCDDISNAKAVLMANISHYGSDVISETTVQDITLQAQQDSMILSVVEKCQNKLLIIKPSDASPVKIEAPKELPKVILMNESLKKLKFHLVRFDNVVKIRTTPDARTEGEYGFEHTKAIFNNEIIPFINL